MKNFNSGNFKNQLGYKSFSPSFVNRNFHIDDNELLILYGEAMRLLGELNIYSSLIADVDFFIQMNVVQEAKMSSMIEGTKTEIEELVLPEGEVDPERRDDWDEVQNYIKAMNFSIESLKDLPLSIRLLKGAHKILLSGVRGEHKMPGEIRRSQNRIGGSSPANALFVPPAEEELANLLSDLEKWWHNSNLSVPPLIKIAISHYQFETIHPFLDGNGRLGRLLIVLQLIDAKILTKPALYLSLFFEKNKAKYNDSLMQVRKSGDLEQWSRFFLKGIIESANDGVKTFEKIIDLRRYYEERVVELGARAKNAQKLILFMFSRPIVTAKLAEDVLGVSFNSANRLLKDLLDMGILKEMTGFSRNRMFILEDYIDLFRK